MPTKPEFDNQILATKQPAENATSINSVSFNQWDLDGLKILGKRLKKAATKAQVRKYWGLGRIKEGDTAKNLAAELRKISNDVDQANKTFSKVNVLLDEQAKNYATGVADINSWLKNPQTAFTKIAADVLLLGKNIETYAKQQSRLIEQQKSSIFKTIPALLTRLFNQAAMIFKRKPTSSVDFDPATSFTPKSNQLSGDTNSWVQIETPSILQSNKLGSNNNWAQIGNTAITAINIAFSDFKYKNDQEHYDKLEKELLVRYSSLSTLPTEEKTILKAKIEETFAKAINHRLDTLENRYKYQEINFTQLKEILAVIDKDINKAILANDDVKKRCEEISNLKPPHDNNEPSSHQVQTIQQALYAAQMQALRHNNLIHQGATVGKLTQLNTTIDSETPHSGIHH